MSGAPAAAQIARPPLHRLVLVEWRKMLDTRASAWLLGITAFAVVAIAIAQGATATGSDAESGAIFQTACGIGSILMPIIPILLVTSEWSQRTALGTFALTPVRERVMTAKLLALLALLVAFSALCLAMSALGAAVAGSGLGFDGSGAGEVVLYQTLSLLFGFGLAAVLMNSPAAIVLNFVVPILIAAVAAISVGVQDVVAWVDPSVWSDLADSSANDWSKIATSTLAWVVLPVAAGLVRLRRRDVS